MKRTIVACLALALTALSGVTATANDEQIAQQIIQRLQQQRQTSQLQDFNIGVQVEDGTVTMMGSVSSSQHAVLALDIARRIPGVKLVVNDLYVQARPEASSPQATPAQEQLIRQPELSQPQPPALQAGQPATTSAQTAAIPAAASQTPANAAAFPVPVPQWAARPVAQASAATSPAAAYPPQAQRVIAAQAFAEAAQQPLVASPPRPEISGTAAGFVPPQQAGPAGYVQQQQAGPAGFAPQRQAIPAGFVQQQQVGPAGFVPQRHAAPATARSANGQRPLAFARTSGARPASYVAPEYSHPQAAQFSSVPGGGPSPVPMMTAGGSGIARAAYDNPQMPGYAWPSYAAYPNYAAVTYPHQYSATAWPYIGPFYPYPQVPLGWRKVMLEWDDGWWFLDFKSK